MSATTVTQGRVVRSEWTKLRTLRSTKITLLVAFAFFLLLAVVLSRSAVNGFEPGERAEFDPIVRTIGAGVHLASLIFGVLGALFMSSEYATGMIRTSLAAVPRRLPLFWGKCLVFFAVTFAVAGIGCLVAFKIGQGTLADKHLEVALGDPGVARALLGAALFASGIGVLGVALGALLRSTAAAIATLTAVLFVLPPIFDLLSRGSSGTLSKLLPGNAGFAMVALHHEHSQLGPGSGFLVFALYLVAAITLAGMLLMRRDA